MNIYYILLLIMGGGLLLFGSYVLFFEIGLKKDHSEYQISENEQLNNQKHNNTNSVQVEVTPVSNVEVKKNEDIFDDEII